jgi:hypothetical protein
VGEQAVGSQKVKLLDELDINGEPPAVTGKICDAFVCQDLRLDGGVEDRAYITHICFEGRWHRLYFEPFMIFWRTVEGAPAAADEPGSECVLDDVGQEHAIVGVRLRSLSHGRSSEWIEARFGFENGITLKIRHDTKRAEVLVVYDPPMGSNTKE